MDRETLGSDLELVVQSADMLWSCLPAKFQRKDFKHPFHARIVVEFKSHVGF